MGKNKIVLIILIWIISEIMTYIGSDKHIISIFLSLIITIYANVGTRKLNVCIGFLQKI